MIKVLKPGFYSTIQDQGRRGFSEFGVPISGAMDGYSAKLANALLGNDEIDAVLEITLTGPKLKFTASTVVCITGANITPKLNDVPIHLNHSININTGDILSFGKLLYGCRAYLGISGGIQTKKVMNSRSMFANITDKIRINSGDELSIKENEKTAVNQYSVIKENRHLLDSKVLKVFKGPEFNLLSKSQQNQLSAMEFTISKNNNRMGYQLVERLENNLKSILTAPVIPGTVQLTPSGELIVLMRDGQTTGGYPRVLQLKEQSINVLAQKRVDDSIRFQF